MVRPDDAGYRAPHSKPGSADRPMLTKCGCFRGQATPSTSGSSWRARSSASLSSSSASRSTMSARASPACPPFASPSAS
eukprot:224960-Prymnesium_polylepis.1